MAQQVFSVAVVLIRCRCTGHIWSNADPRGSRPGYQDGIHYL